MIKKPNICRIFFTARDNCVYLRRINLTKKMLKKFKVSNFKNFEKDFVFDLSETNGYEFNPDCVKNGIANNIIVYGRNGSGKSNLGFAIFDIIEHLTDNNRSENRYDNYLNGNSKSAFAEFHYEFLINDNIVEYKYRKTDYKTLVYERLSINNIECVLFDRTNGSNNFSVNLQGAESLNRIITDKSLSALKYIKNNTVLGSDVITQTFLSLFDFINKMLFFRSLEDRMYLGMDSFSGKSILDDIIERDKVADYQKFLNDAKIDCKLSVVEDMGRKTIAFKFDKKVISYTDVVSTGTNSLTLFYGWYLRVIESGVSMLFIDEFDAFYHHELSELVVEKLKKSGVQFILTTHNTSIMTNELMRPDCYFIINRKDIRPLSKCTDKELREAHNLEKFYKSMVANEN